jgi:ubiquinone/menaquinone biosynthesis C-methylase UbiE
MKFKKYIKESEKEFWNKVYKEGEHHWMDKKPSNLTRKVINKYKNLGNVLEIGCAAGIDTVVLATAAKSVIGIDIVKDAVDTAKENLTKCTESIRSKVKYEEGDAEKLKYDDNQFDFVYSLSVLHSTDVEKSLKEIRRVLNDKGKAVIYVYIGDKQEEINKDHFLKVSSKYFKITNRNEIDITDKGKDKHKALIVNLEAI